MAAQLDGDKVFTIVGRLYIEAQMAIESQNDQLANKDAEITALKKRLDAALAREDKKKKGG